MSLPSCTDVKKMCQKLLVKGKDTGVLWSQGERQWWLCNSTRPSAVNPLPMVSEARPLELLHEGDQSSRLQKNTFLVNPRRALSRNKNLFYKWQKQTPNLFKERRESLRAAFAMLIFTQRYILTAGIRWCANLYVLAIFFSYGNVLQELVQMWIITFQKLVQPLVGGCREEWPWQNKERKNTCEVQEK